MEKEKNEIDETLLALLLEDIKGKVKRPTLDTLLEKINEKGFESLTPYEKDSLEFYSKN